MTYKLLRHSRFSYDVFTQEGAEDWSYGIDRDCPESEGVRRICARSSELSTWMEEAYRYFIAHKDEYDMVMTRSMPPECHRVGLRIKKQYPEKRWIASFGDPIKDNPYELIGGTLQSPYSMKNSANRGRRLIFRLSPIRLLLLAVWNLRHAKALIRRRELASLEEETIALADALVFNNKSQLRYMMHAAAPHKAVIIRHSYDLTLFPKPVIHNSDGRIRFVFTGQLNALRSAHPLLEAIARLKEDVAELPCLAEFQFIGDMPDMDLAFILRHGLTDLVTVRPPVSYRCSLAEASSADWLIHIDGNIDAVTGENVFFAGKIADYFGAAKPILAISMTRGDAADCLRRAGAVLLSYSVNEIKQALYQIICLRRQPASMNTDYIRSFSAEQVAAEFDEKVVSRLL